MITYETNQLEDFLNILQFESDRACAIINGAQLEYLLKKSIY